MLLSRVPPCPTRLPTRSRFLVALARGELVLGDRFVSSTLAYQGAAGGMPEHDILHAAEVACAGTWPDLTVILDVDEATAARRLWLVPLFAAGPELMAGIRQGVFGSVLFFGNHARIDRMGLAHGLAISRRSGSAPLV